MFGAESLQMTHDSSTVDYRDTGMHLQYFCHFKGNIQAQIHEATEIRYCLKAAIKFLLCIEKTIGPCATAQRLINWNTRLAGIMP